MGRRLPPSPGTSAAWAGRRPTGVASDGLLRRPPRPLEILPRDQPGRRSRAPRAVGARARGSRWSAPATSPIRPGARRSATSSCRPSPGCSACAPRSSGEIERALPAACRRADALHAGGRDLDHLQEGRADAEGPPPDLRARPRDGGAHSGRGSPRIGNIASDGRPILGLDSRHLLEIALESGPTPIWCRRISGRRGSPRSARSRASTRSTSATAICADHIFAVETGLSSDPPMNWRVSLLDRFASRQQLGRAFARQARPRGDAFDCDLDYFAMRRALETGRGLRRHGRVLSRGGQVSPRRPPQMRRAAVAAGDAAAWRALPGLRRAADGGRRAPRRGAGRPQRGRGAPPATAGAVSNLVPLPEMLSEIAGSGVAIARRSSAATTGDRRARRRSFRILQASAGRGHRARRLGAARRGDHAAARRQGDPRRRL